MTTTWPDDNDGWDPKEEMNDAVFDDTDWEWYSDPSTYPIDDADEPNSAYNDEDEDDWLPDGPMD